ncbi:hypothetical protein Tco_0290628 [Tanacetum coccineum]
MVWSRGWFMVKETKHGVVIKRLLVRLDFLAIKGFLGLGVVLQCGVGDRFGRFIGYGVLLGVVNSLIDIGEGSSVVSRSWYVLGCGIENHGAGRDSQEKHNGWSVVQVYGLCARVDSIGIQKCRDEYKRAVC